MKIEQVAAITSSVGRFAKEPEGVKDVLTRIREIGYQAVQISGIAWIPEEELRAHCDRLGLTICATHEPGVKLFDETDAVIERLKKLACALTAYPYPHVGITADGIAALVAKLDEVGAKLASAGIRFMYHNHHVEFQRFDGKTAMDMIYDGTDPKHLLGEPDTHWIQRGGCDPVAWCEKLSGRLPVLHMKDYRIDAEKNPEMCAVGSGNLDWSRILPAAERAGCEWYVVEHDGGSFESLADSYAFLSAYCSRG